MPELPAAAAAQLAAQLAELGEEFQRSLPARVGQIEAAVMALGERLGEGADGEGGGCGESSEAALRELSAAAHRLAGAAGTFGYPALGATALQMEALARQLQADPAARVVGSASARETVARLLATLKAAVDAAPLLSSTTASAESVGGLATAPALRPPPVLVVGDDEMSASALLAMLASAGILAEAIGDREKLLARLQDMLPDLIVMDRYLPGCRGDELVAVIRQNDAWQEVPIVYLSVEADCSKQLQALEQGDARRTLIQAADRAPYETRRTGRNRVEPGGALPGDKT